MPVPLSLVPAAAAALAYLNARTSAWYDFKLARAIVPSVILMSRAERCGRLSLFYSLEDLAANERYANQGFLRFGDRSHSYAQVYTMALRFGQWLRKRFGVNKGDIVALDFMNSDVYVFLMFGLWAIGAKPALINYNLRGKALVHCVTAAKTALCLVDPSLKSAVTDNLKQALPGTRFEVLWPDLEAEALATEPVRGPDSLRHENKFHEMAILIYTSGTTGLPKAAVVSWGKIMVAGNFTSRLIGLKLTDVYYTCMPLYHSTATLMGLSNVLATGATLAIGVKFSTTNFWKDVRRHDASVIQYVGETCRYLLAAPKEYDPVTGACLDTAHSVRMAHGNGLRPDVWNKFKDRFGIETIVEFYGSTEGSFATYNVSRNDFGAGAIGRNGWLYSLFLSYSIAFVRVDYDTDLAYRDPKTGFCRRAVSGEPGEFIFRLPKENTEQRFQGYFGNKEATEAKILRNVFCHGDAWLRTGDVIRADSDGRLFFHDRIGDTFRWKGENVSTEEVSQALGRHPAVREANVYGVQLPHHDGRAGCAALTLSESDSSAELLQSLAHHATSELPKFAVPQFLRVVTEMEATGTNKQQKHGLRVQGVDPAKVGGDVLFWLRDGAYVPFRQDDWDRLGSGGVKL